MTKIDERLARKGKREPLHAVLQQARVLQSLAKKYKATLAKNGWDENDANRFAHNIAAAEKAKGGRDDASGQAKTMTRSEQSAIDTIKAFLRRLRLALPRVLRTHSALGVTMKSFTVGEPLRRSTPRTIAYLIKIRSAVEKLDQPLKKHFGGASATAQLDAAKQALEKVDTDQESARAAGPGETQALNEAIGRLMEDIEDLVRAGKSAFDGQAVIVANFNKDIILRARRRKKDENGET